MRTALGLVLLGLATVMGRTLDAEALGAAPASAPATGMRGRRLAPTWTSTTLATADGTPLEDVFTTSASQVVVRMNFNNEQVTAISALTLSPANCLTSITYTFNAGHTLIRGTVNTAATGAPGACSVQLVAGSATPNLASDTDTFQFFSRPAITNFEVLSPTSTSLNGNPSAVTDFRIRVTLSANAKTINQFTSSPTNCAFLNGIVSGTDTNVLVYDMGLDPPNVDPTTGACSITLSGNNVAPALTGSSSASIMFQPTATIAGLNSGGSLLAGDGITTFANVFVRLTLSGAAGGFSTAGFTYNPSGCGTGGSVTSATTSTPRAGVTLNPAVLSTNGACTVTVPASAVTPPTDGADSYTFNYQPTVSSLVAKDTSDNALAGGVTTNLDIKVVATLTGPVGSISALTFTPAGCGTMTEGSTSGNEAIALVTLVPASLNSNSECTIGFPTTATIPNHGTSGQSVTVRYAVNFAVGSVGETLSSSGVTLADGVTDSLNVRTRFTFTGVIGTITAFSYSPAGCGTIGATTVSGTTASTAVTLNLASLSGSSTCAVTLSQTGTDPDLGTAGSRTATFTYRPSVTSTVARTTGGALLENGVTGSTTFVTEFSFTDDVTSVNSLTFSPDGCGSLVGASGTSTDVVLATILLDSTRLTVDAQCTITLPTTGATPTLAASASSSVTVTFRLLFVAIEVGIDGNFQSVVGTVNTDTTEVVLAAEFSSDVVGIDAFTFSPTGCGSAAFDSVSGPTILYAISLNVQQLGVGGTCTVSFAGEDVNPGADEGSTVTFAYQPVVASVEARSALDAVLANPNFITTQTGVARFQMSGPIGSATGVSFSPAGCATLASINVDVNNVVRAAVTFDFTVIPDDGTCAVTLNPSNTAPPHGSPNAVDNTVTFNYRPVLLSVATLDAAGSPTGGSTAVRNVQASFSFSAPIRLLGGISTGPNGCAVMTGSSVNSATIVADLTINADLLDSTGQCEIWIDDGAITTPDTAYADQWAIFTYRPTINSFAITYPDNTPFTGSISEVQTLKTRIQFSDRINNNAQINYLDTMAAGCLSYQGSFTQDATGFVEFLIAFDPASVDQTTGECNFAVRADAVVPSHASSEPTKQFFYTPRAIEWSFWDPTKDPCQEEGAIKLVGSVNANEGAVQVCHLGNWKGVCDDDWGLNDAQVVCRQIGAGSALGAPHSSEWTSANFAGYWMDDVDCDGTESTLFGCKSNGIGRHNCDDGEQAGVVCQSAPTANPTSSRILSSTRGEEFGTFRVVLTGPINVFNTANYVTENLYTKAVDPLSLFGPIDAFFQMSPNEYFLFVRFRTGELADAEDDPFSIIDYVALTLPTSATSPPLRMALPRVSIPYQPQLMWMDVRRNTSAIDPTFANFNSLPSDNQYSPFYDDDQDYDDNSGPDYSGDFDVLSGLTAPSHEWLYIRFSGRVLRVLTDAIRGNGMAFDDEAAIKSFDGKRWLIPAHLLVGTLTNTFPPRVIAQSSFQVPKTAVAPTLHGDSFFTHIAYSPIATSLQFIDSNGIARTFAEDDGQTGTIRATFSGAVSDIRGASTTLISAELPTPNADRTVWTSSVTVFTNPANSLADFRLYRDHVRPFLDTDSDVLELRYRPRVVNIQYLSLADEVLDVIYEKNYEGKVRFTFSGPMTSLDTTKVNTLQVTFTGAAVQSNGDRVWTYPATFTVGNPVSDPVLPNVYEDDYYYSNDDEAILTPLADRATIVVNPLATVPRIREESARFTIPYVVQVASTRFLDASLSPITTFRASGTYYFEIQFTDTFRELPIEAVQFSANAQFVVRSMPAADTYRYQLTVSTDAAANVVADFTAVETEPASEAVSGFTLTYVPRLDTYNVIRTDSMAPVSSSDVAMDARLQLTFSGRVTAINTASISLDGLSITGAFAANAAGTVWTAPVRLHLGDVNSGVVVSSAVATILPAASTPTHEIVRSTPTVSYVPTVTGATFLLDDGMGAWTAITSSALRQPGRVRIAFSSNVASVNTAAFTGLEGITFNSAVTMGPASEWTFEVQFNTGGLVAAVLQDDAAFTVATAAVTPNTGAPFSASIPYRPRVLSVAFLNAVDATLTYSNADQNGFLLVTFSDRVTTATLASFTLVGIASRAGSPVVTSQSRVWKFPVVIAATPVDPEVTIPTTAVVPNLVAASNTYTIDYRVDVQSIVFRRGAASVTTFREDETIVARVTFTDPVSVLPASAFSVSAGGVVDGVPAMFGGVGDVWDVPVTLTSGASVSVSFVSGATTPETNAGGAATITYVPQIESVVFRDDVPAAVTLLNREGMTGSIVVTFYGTVTSVDHAAFTAVTGITFSAGTNVGRVWTFPVVYTAGSLVSGSVVSTAAFTVPTAAVVPAAASATSYSIPYRPTVTALAVLAADGMTAITSVDRPTAAKVRATFSGPVTSVTGSSLTVTGLAIDAAAPVLSNGQRTVTFDATITLGGATVLTTASVLVPTAAVSPALSAASTATTVAYVPTLTAIEFVQTGTTTPFTSFDSATATCQLRLTYSGGLTSVSAAAFTLARVAVTNAGSTDLARSVWTFNVALSAEWMGVAYASVSASAPGAAATPAAAMNSLSATVAYLPTISSVRFQDSLAAPITTFKEDSSAVLRVVFTGPVNSLDLNEISIFLGTAALSNAVADGARTTWTVDVALTSGALVLVRVSTAAAEPAAGGSAVLSLLSYVPEFVSGAFLDADDNAIADYHTTQTVHYLVTFSGRITNLPTSAVAATHATVVRTWAATPSSWYVELATEPADDIEILITGANVSPAAAGSHSDSLLYRPHIESVAFLDAADAVVSSFAAAFDATVRVTFSGPVRAVPLSAFAFAAGLDEDLAGAITSSSDGTTWMLPYRVLDGEDSTVMVDASAVEPAAAAGASASITYVPEVVSAVIVGAVGGEERANYTRVADYAVVFTFTGVVHNVSEHAVSVSNAAVSRIAVSSNGREWTVFFTTVPADDVVAHLMAEHVVPPVAADAEATLTYIPTIEGVTIRSASGADRLEVFPADTAAVVRVVFSGPVRSLPRSALVSVAGSFRFRGAASSTNGVAWSVPVTLNAGAHVGVMVVSDRIVPRAVADRESNTVVWDPPKCELQCGEGFCVGLEEESRCVCNPGFVVNATTLVCQESTTPRCDDGRQNGDETDIDCGRWCTDKCVSGRTCRLSVDCAAGLVCLELPGGRRCASRIVEQGVYVRVQGVNILGLTTAQFTGSVRQAYVNAVLHTVESAEAVTIDRVSAYTAPVNPAARMRALQATATTTGITVDFSVSTALDSGVRSAQLREQIRSAIGAPADSSVACNASTLSAVLSNFVGQVPALSSTVQLEACSTVFTSEVVQTSQDRSSLEAQPDDEDDVGGAAAGIAIAAVVVVVFIAFVAWYRCRRTEESK